MCNGIFVGSPSTLSKDLDFAMCPMGSPLPRPNLERHDGQDSPKLPHIEFTALCDCNLPVQVVESDLNHSDVELRHLRCGNWGTNADIQCAYLRQAGAPLPPNNMPLKCHCNKLARMLQIKDQPENVGRWFGRCDRDDQDGCGYWRWLDGSPRYFGGDITWLGDDLEPLNPRDATFIDITEEDMRSWDAAYDAVEFSDTDYSEPEEELESDESEDTGRDFSADEASDAQQRPLELMFNLLDSSIILS